MMRPVPPLFALVLGLMLPALSGCYSMYGQPYGSPYGGYPAGPGGYGTPMQTLTPGQPYSPGVIPQGQGLPNTYNPSGLQPIPDNNAPNYNPAPGGANNPAVPNPYPYYGNPNSTQLNNLRPVTDNGIQPVANNNQQFVKLPSGGAENRVANPPGQLLGTGYNPAPGPAPALQPIPRLDESAAFQPPISNLPQVPPAQLKPAPGNPYPGKPNDPPAADPFAFPH